MCTHTHVHTQHTLHTYTGMHKCNYTAEPLLYTVHTPYNYTNLLTFEPHSLALM